MKKFSCNFCFSAFVVLAVVAHACALIVGGLPAFGGASLAFALVLGYILD